jgi:hypothetical protein
VKSSRCHHCGWIEIDDIKLSLQSFPPRRYLRPLLQSVWVYVVFSIVILAAGYLISAEVITSAKNFSLQDVASLFSEKSETAGENKAGAVTTEAPVVPDTTARAALSLPGASSVRSESAPLRHPEKNRVVANSKSKLYHLPGMKYYDKIPSDRRVIFTSEEAAQQAGYRKSAK